MDNNIILFGASGHCKVVADALLASGKTVSLILDDNPKCGEIFGISVKLFDNDDLIGKNLLLAIGNNAVRKKLSAKFDANFVTAIHPNSIVSKFATVGTGSVVLAGAIINPDAVIGRHAIVNTGAVIEHDCFVGDFAHISPNASLAGNVSIGEGTHIGIGASVIQGVKIGKWAIIGAGTAVIADVEDFAVVVGTPGRTIKYMTGH